MVVRKILEATLVAGSTSVTFTDTDIPNSLLRVYCSRSALFPISQTLSGNSVTVNYKPQDSNIGVALEIVKSGLDIVDDLTTEDNTKALSANQGYILKGLIDGIVIPTVPENITDLDDVDVTDIDNGQVLAWNSITEKFENVDQSGGSSSHDYSTTEKIIGKWTDGITDVYECVITGLALAVSNAWSNAFATNLNIAQVISAEYIDTAQSINIDVEQTQAYGNGVRIQCSRSINGRSISTAIIRYIKASS